jgi:hypothetical protein
VARRFSLSSWKIAENLDDVDAQLQTLWSLWGLHLVHGECRSAQSTVEGFYHVALRTDDAATVLVADRLIGNTLQYQGKLREARDHLERVLELYVAPTTPQHTIWFHYDQRALAPAMLARVLWLQGFVEHGIARANEAQAAGHKLSLCWVLHYTCPIALMTGDLVAAEK